jgi:hypothetical protein
MSKLFDTCICIHVSNLKRVCQYTCQNVQLVTSTFNTRLTRVKMHVANCLTRVQCRTRVKMHVAICNHFCSVFTQVCALCLNKTMLKFPLHIHQLMLASEWSQRIQPQQIPITSFLPLQFPSLREQRAISSKLFYMIKSILYILAVAFLLMNYKTEAYWS